MSTVDHPPADPPAALPRGTRLAEFELRRVLGIGGFGIVYLAFDHALEREVAVKEYMPSSLVGRSGPLQVSLLSQANAEPFSLGLRSFVNEARLLARFDHPSLVKVHRYWEANGTAYMAMPYYTGSNLHATRRRMTAPPDETWLRNILEPLLGAIERLHNEGVYHRDISPDNVILQPDGRPVLLDFGAARRVLGDKSMALTAILKPAYAPIEQYAEAGAVKQGPWTDFYSLGATLHFLLLGRAPTPATTRTVVDEMPPLAGQTAALPGCSAPFLRCVDWMLQPRPADRPRNVAALRVRLAQALLDRDDDAAAARLASGDGQPGWPTTQLLGAAPAATEATDDPTTVIDLSALPATLAPPPTPDLSATVLMPRAGQASPDATVVMPRAGATPPDATVVMPRAAAASSDATVVMPRAAGPAPDATVVMPRAAQPEADATVVMPRTQMPPPAQAAAAAAMASFSPAAPPAAPRLATPGSAAQRTDPTLHDRPDLTANDADPRGRPVAARPPAWRWPVAAGAAGAAGLALWWGLQATAPQPGAGSVPAQAAASAESAASAASGGLAGATGAVPVAGTVNPAALPAPGQAAPANAPGLATAAAPAASAAPTPPDNTAAAAVLARGSGKPANPPGAPAIKAATSAAAKPAPAAKTAAQQSAPEPAPVPAPTSAVAGPSGPPSLATSITRLPPAAEPAAANTAPAIATAASRPAATPGPDTTRPGAVGGPAAGSTTGAPAGTATPPALPGAGAYPPTPAAATRAAPSPQARAAERDADPVLLQTRALSPVERCEGRVQKALWACIERVCKAEAALRDHPDCVKARREQ